MDFQAQASTVEQKLKYLRSLIAGEIQQKVRLEDTIASYQAEMAKITEYIVDQADLIRTLEAEAAVFPEVPADKAKQLEQAKSRLDRHLGLKKDYEIRLGQLNDRNLEVINDMQAHMIELSAIEVELGGFVAHIFGFRSNVKYDEGTKALTFYPTGSAAVPIATDLPSWKDSSQMTIIKREEN